MKRRTWSHFWPKPIPALLDDRSDTNVNLSRRRSRVRVPSLPLKELQISMLCCRLRRQIEADYTELSRRATQRRQKAWKRSRASRFQADSGRV